MNIHSWHNFGIQLKFFCIFRLSEDKIDPKRNENVLSTPLLRNTERWNTQPRRSVLSHQEAEDETWEWRLAIGTELRLLASSSVTRFPLHPRVCPLFPASLTSLLDGHASLCLPWNAIQTAKQPGIETTSLYRGAGSNYSENRPTVQFFVVVSCDFSSSAAHS